MADVERVKDMVACMGDALAAFKEDYSVSELLSAEASLFLTTARVAIERAPLAREGIVAIVQHMLLSLTDVTDKQKVH